MNNTTSGALVPFDFEGSQIRVFTDEQGDPWFVGADVCSVLGIGNPRQAMSRLDEDERVSFQLTPLALCSPWLR